jgi:large subunit ribosomal protein L21
MFAIVDIAGQQLKVSPSERIFVPHRPESAGETVTFDRVILIADETTVRIGTPTVKSASVQGKILGHAKDDKVTVFKKKKRKGYRVTRGHRQQYTEIEITNIG